ncbi:glycoside-pentoside-hexuronide (GPH):cation symporter [Streptomyces nogalater]|uniref:MFS transporter n=1 Tax=Streptomyces nogalater TaxID=38314 RepID=A0ABW0WPR2_STRNO
MPPPAPAVTPETSARPAVPAKAAQLGYGLGDLASNLTWTTLTVFLLYYYTDVAGLAATTAGTILLVGRIADAVIDPVVGLVVDRTRSRFGRARPYLIFAAPVLGIAFALAFSSPGGGTAAVVWAALTFVVVGISHSLVNVPYGAMLPMLTDDAGTRLKMSGYRFVGASLGLIAVSLAVMPLVGALGGADRGRGFTGMAIILGTVGTLLYWIVAVLCRERPAAPAARAATTWRALASLRGNRHWLGVSAASLIAFVRLGIITAGAVFYAREVLDDAWATSYILLAFSLSALAGSLVTPWFLRRAGKRRGIDSGLAVTAALYVLLFFLDGQPMVFLAVFLFANLTGGFGFVAAPALVSDTIDHHETLTGRRDEGLLYAGYSFATKVGTALGGSLFAWALAWGGYRAEHVSARASQAIEWAFIGLPALLCLAQAACMALYGLEDRER